MYQNAEAYHALFSDHNSPHLITVVFDRQLTIQHANPTFNLLASLCGKSQFLNHFLDVLKNRFSLPETDAWFTEQPFQRETTYQELTLKLLLFPLNQNTLFLNLQYINQGLPLKKIQRKLLHDLRTPLSTALMALNNLRFVMENENSQDQRAAVQEFLQMAENGLNQVTYPLNIVHNLTRSEMPALTHQNLSELLIKIEQKHQPQVVLYRKTTTCWYPVNKEMFWAALESFIKVLKAMNQQLLPLGITIRENDQESYSITLGLQDHPFTCEDLILKTSNYYPIPAHLKTEFATGEYLLFLLGMRTFTTFNERQKAFNVTVILPKKEEVDGKDTSDRR